MSAGLRLKSSRGASQRRRAGAISFAVPAALIVGVFSGALAIDLGRIAWERRDLQATADLAALDAVRAFGSCRENSSDPLAAAQASALRNGFTGDLTQGPNVVAVGRVDAVDGLRRFTPLPDTATASAVRVFATESVPRSLLAGYFLPGEATLSAEAVAERPVTAGLRAGSYAARANPTSIQILNDVLGGFADANVQLDLLSYENLMGAGVSFEDLQLAAGAGSPEAFLDMELTAGEYVEVLATALDRQGESDASAALREIGGVDETRTFHVDELFSMTPEALGDPRDVIFNSFDLLDIGLQVARGDDGVVVDPLGISPAGIASVGVRMKIVQAPQLAVGPPGRGADGAWQTVVRTGQIRMAIELRVEQGFGLLGNNPVAFDVFVEAAPTVAHLDAVDCADADDPIHRVVVGVEPGLVRMGIGRYPDFDTSPEPVPSEVVQLDAPGLGAGPVASVRASGDLPFRSSSQRLDFEGPFYPTIDEPSEDNSRRVGSEVGEAVANALVSMVASTDVDIELLGGSLPVSEQAVLARTAALLELAFRDLDEPVSALFQALGLHLGGADVTVTSLGVKPPELAI